MKHSQVDVVIIVIPFKVRNLVPIEFSKRIDDVGAQIGVDVRGHELAHSVPVLRPVGIVADHYVLCQTYKRGRTTGHANEFIRLTNSITIILQDLLLNLKQFR